MKTIDIQEWDNDEYNLYWDTTYLNNNGNKHGVEKCYNNDGKIQCETPFFNNKAHGIQLYYEDNDKMV